MSELKPCQMTSEEAACCLEKRMTRYHPNDAITEATKIAIDALRRAQPANEPLVTCGECAKYQTPDCAAKHEQALMDFCSHGIRKPGGEQE